MKIYHVVLLALGAIALCGCPRQLPIQAVILSDDNGANKASVTLAQIDIWVNTANEMFTEHGFELVFNHADVVEVKSTLLNRPPETPDD